MDSRRKFIGKVASGLAGTLATSNVLGANDRIRIGVVGTGDRGQQLMREAALCGAEIVGAADVFTRRLEQAKGITPALKAHVDYRYLLDDKEIDAIIVATPQHLHGEHFVAALDAGKHVYQEKTMAFTVEQAKRMREAYQRAAGKLRVQVGHQTCSSGQIADAVNFSRHNLLGKVSAIRGYMYRNTPHGKPQWARPVYPDITPETVHWSSFLGEAPSCEFDANRYVNWRYFWDYSGGNVHENMSHQISFWYKVLGLQIPQSVSMTGGVFLWKDGREVPDTMSVAMTHAEELLFTWDSGFGNNHLGSSETVLGTDGTVEKGQQIRYYPQKVNRPDGSELMGTTRSSNSAHMQNFFESMRSGHETNCPFELGFCVSIACCMAVESYRQGRTVRWDPVREEIV